MNYSAVQTRQQLLQAVSKENPFVDVSGSVYLLARMVIGMYILAMLIFAGNSREPAPYMSLRLLARTMEVLVATLPLWWRLPKIGIFHPLYILSALSFLKTHLPNIRIYAEGISYHPVLSMTASEVSLLDIKIVALKILLTTCVYTGFFMTRGISWNFVKVVDRQGVRLFASVAAVIAGTVSLFLLMELSGGFFDHLKNISRGHANKVWVKDEELASMYAVLIPMMVLAPAFWILAGKHPYINPLFWAISAWSILGAYLVNGRRSATVMMILVLVACWILRRKSLAIGRLGIIGIVVFLMIGILGDFRKSNWRGKDVNFESFTSTDFNTAFTKTVESLEARRQGGAVFPIVAKVPSQVPFLWGKNYFDYINRFIPRVIWKDKPRGIGISCAEVFYRRFEAGGIPPGGLGEAYWSGGVAGVIIVFLLWGMILRSIGNFFLKFHHSAIASVVYLATITRLGPSEQAFRGWLYLIAPTLMALYLLGVFRVVRSK